ncbi:MAG: glycosyltransferase [Acidobacteria bacterium]|nr:glycosyltransferase [Acidobacteriota bacterium]
MTASFPKLSIVVPFYDDINEALSMIVAARALLQADLKPEFIMVSLQSDRQDNLRKVCSEHSVRYFSAPNLPAAKNLSVSAAGGDCILFLFPGIFPTPDAIEALVNALQQNAEVAAVAGQWFNAAGKLEVGYNVRRFPTFTALLLDILLLNKLFPQNRFTRSYKMHDFDHDTSIRVQHANDCVFLVRKQSAQRNPFNEEYEAGWFDQVEFCQRLHDADLAILYEPRARFVSNEKVPLIDRMVRDRYVVYRRTEYLYVRRRFGLFASRIVQVAVALGMLQRIGFSIMLPPLVRRWLISSLRSYVDDDYVTGLQNQYWSVLKKTVRGQL